MLIHLLEQRLHVQAVPEVVKELDKLVEFFDADLDRLSRIIIHLFRQGIDDRWQTGRRGARQSSRDCCILNAVGLSVAGDRRVQCIQHSLVLAWLQDRFIHEPRREHAHVIPDVFGVDDAFTNKSTAKKKKKW